MVSALARPLPVVHGRLAQAGRRVVMRQQLGLGLHRLSEPRFQHLRNPLMVLLPSASQQRLIRHILEQSMLERIRRLRRHPLLVEHLRLDELHQAAPHRQFIQGRHGSEQVVGKGPPQHRPQLRHRLALAQPIQPRHERVLERGGNG